MHIYTIRLYICKFKVTLDLFLKKIDRYRTQNLRLIVESDYLSMVNQLKLAYNL